MSIFSKLFRGGKTPEKQQSTINDIHNQPPERHSEKQREIERLIKALRNEDGHSRLDAVRALGRIGDASVVEALIAALDDKEDYVRWNVAEALGKIR
jgi:HEAT repeat protein